MARTLTTTFLREVFSQESGAVPVFLLTITHPALSVPIRVSSDPTQRLSATDTQVIYGTKSRGNDFYFFPFTLTLPEEGDSGPQEMTLELDNITRDITLTLRSIEGPPTITTELVLAESPNSVEATWPDFLLTSARYNASRISGTLTLETLVREPWPYLRFTPNYFSGVF